MRASYEKFARLLDEKDLTPYKVSKLSGVATTTLSDWKNGKSTPKTDKIAKIADALGVSSNYFYDDEAEEENRQVVDFLVLEAFSNPRTKEHLLQYARELLDGIEPFPQYPGVTQKDISTFAARNVKRNFTEEEIAEMIYEIRKED